MRSLIDWLYQSIWLFRYGCCKLLWVRKKQNYSVGMNDFDRKLISVASYAEREFPNLRLLDRICKWTATGLEPTTT